MLTRTQRLSLSVKLRRARRKETMSTTSTRSITNIKGPTNQSNLKLESFFFSIYVQNLKLFLMRSSQTLGSLTSGLYNVKIKG